jgi:uncharacterized membrane protein YcaP (DUF421 family)
MDISSVFTGDWQGVIKIALAAPVMYLAVIVFIRFAGKRSTSQMNNFDWIVTVAIGSMTASGILLKDISVLDALLAIFMLLVFQYIMTKAIFNSAAISDIVKAEPAVLVRKGQYLKDAMRRERVTEAEIMAAVRESGLINIQECRWVILETDATFSVIKDDSRDFSRAEFDNVDKAGQT